MLSCNEQYPQLKELLSGDSTVSCTGLFIPHIFSTVWECSYVVKLEDYGTTHTFNEAWIYTFNKVKGSGTNLKREQLLELYKILVAHRKISCAVGCLLLPWEREGHTVRRWEPGCFHRSLSAPSGRGSEPPVPM